MNFLYTKVSLLVFVSIFINPLFVKSQICIGTVVDSLTGENLKFVHIGVVGKNLGVISDDNGLFKLDLTKIKDEEFISFSMIGYNPVQLTKTSVLKKNLIVKLYPISYQLQEIVVKGKEQKEVKLGRFEISKTTSGQSGIDKFGFGGEWGILIKHPEKNYYLKEVKFHTRFNTVDSVLYRINVYESNAEFPGSSLVLKEVFTKSYSKDKWISSNLLSQNLLIEEDIIVTFELVQIWYKRKGKNLLFYTHGKGYEEGKSFSKDSSFDIWKINKRGPIAMYVTGIQVDNN